jgi:phage recombination protein Bet
MSNLKKYDAQESAIKVFSKDEEELIRKTFGHNLTKNEFELFLYTAKGVGLNPLRRQIYAIKRKQYNPETRSYEDRMTIQTGIDGFRAVSFRNGSTIPGKEPEFRYTTEKSPANPIGLISATAYLKVHGQDGKYHEVSATAYWDEYVPLKDGKPMAMWAKMPRTMLAKCAEALLHRRCNPEQLSGIYTSEEMNQADADKKVIEGVHYESEPAHAIPEHTTTDAEVPTTPTETEVVEVEEVIKDDLEKVKQVFPEAKTEKVQKKGKFGFLDEVRKLKADLKKQNGNDEEYYQILGVIGPGSYEHANEINDRQEQVAFWKALKLALSDKEEK